MMSNLGAQFPQHRGNEQRFKFAAASGNVMRVSLQSFRPEFLNRVDDIVIFHPLEEAQLQHILDLRLRDLNQMLAERHITVELTEAARHQLFLTGFDRAYGARPLKRAIQRLVQDRLAMKILDGEILHGDQVLLYADPLHECLDVKVKDRAVPA